MGVEVPKQKMLLGPGPSNSDPRVLEALSWPTLGHLDPDFLEMMDDTADLLRYVFGVQNEVTFALPGTGSAGMEAALVNSLEAGDKAIICTCGFFGDRMIDVAQRAGAKVVTVKASWGNPVDPSDVKRAVKDNLDAKVVAVVHAETSTGVLQPLEEIAEIAHANGMRLVVDAVTSLGGMEVPAGKLGLDFVYSCTQKCLGCPPGLSPVTLSDDAKNWIDGRKTKCQSWYLDLSMLQKYWGSQRLYHHTAPSNMVYALNKGLTLIKEEGLAQSFKRHKNAQNVLVEGLKSLGLTPLVEERYALPSITTVFVKEGIDEAAVRKRLLDDFQIEIGSGLGVFKGQIWRIGTMGFNAKEETVRSFLEIFEDVLKDA